MTTFLHCLIILVLIIWVFVINPFIVMWIDQRLGTWGRMEYGEDWVTGFCFSMIIIVIGYVGYGLWLLANAKW